MKVHLGKERHADNFEDGCVVFDNGVVIVKVSQWNDKGRKTFDVFVDGDRITSTSNYPKAIGLGVLEYYRRHGW